MVLRREVLFSLPEFEPRFLDHPFRNLVTIPTKPSVAIKFNYFWRANFILFLINTLQSYFPRNYTLFAKRLVLQTNITSDFNTHGSVHRNNFFNIYPIRCNVTQFILSVNLSTCFGWYHHPSSGAQTTVSTASDICHTVTSTCR